MAEQSKKMAPHHLAHYLKPGERAPGVGFVETEVASKHLTLLSQMLAELGK